MTLNEAEATARSIVAVQEKYGAEFPSEMAAGVLARALLAILPVVKAAEEWHDRQCTGEHQLCRETVDLHAQECAVEAREFDLYDAIDAMRARMGEK